ncbi:hypothetical protein [Bradyrhizobium sp. USDA 4506]
MLTNALASAGPYLHETLDETVSHRLSPACEVPIDDGVLAPGELALQVNLVLTSDTIILGLPPPQMMAFRSRATQCLYPSELRRGQRIADFTD